MGDGRAARNDGFTIAKAAAPIDSHSDCISRHISIGYAGDRSYIPKLSLFPVPRTRNHTGSCRRSVSYLRYSDTSIQDQVHGAVKRGLLEPYLAGQ